MDFSLTAIKALKRLSKENLVKKVIEMHNYAEHLKASNIVLSNAMEKIKHDRAAELKLNAEGKENETR